MDIQRIKKYNASNKRLTLVINILFYLFLVWFIQQVVFSFNSRGSSSTISIIIKQLLKLKIDPVKIQGLSASGDRYSITSSGMKNYMENFFYKKNIFFNDPIIHIFNNKDQLTLITADQGIFIDKDSNFKMSHEIKVIFDTSIVLSTEQAIFDLKNIAIKSSTNTLVEKIQNGIVKFTIKSNGVLLTNNMEHITFKGHVLMSDDRKLLKDFK